MELEIISLRFFIFKITLNLINHPFSENETKRLGVVFVRDILRNWQVKKKIA